MTQTATDNSSNRIYWLYFSIALIIQVLLVIYVPIFFWITLPFVLAFLVKAFGKM